MGCIVIGTGIIDCTPPQDPLCQRLHDALHFEQDLSRAGSEWNRSIADPIAFKQSDYFTEDLTDNLLLVQTVDWERCKIRALTSAITFLDSAEVSGGRFPSGGAGEIPPISAIFDSLTLKGMALYVPSTGHVDLAQADAIATAVCVGLANEDVLAAATGDYITEGQITRSDWTAVAGSTNLTPGVAYYVSPTTAGTITATPPSTVGQVVTVVGVALTTKILDVEVAQPIIL